MQKVLITGLGGPAGKSAAEYFRQKGFFIAGTDVREVDVRADSFHTVPMALDPAYGRALMGIIRKERPALLIPTVTEELPVTASMKGDIEALGCAVFISPSEGASIANDKLRTARFLESRGVAVPRTFDESAPREKIIAELGFPMLSKPVFGRGGRGVTVYSAVGELLSEKRPGLIFQEFIPGDEFDANIFVDEYGVVRASVLLRKTELKDGIVGNAVKVERVVGGNARSALALAERAVLELGLRGPLDVDIRLRKDGTPAVLEINARVGGNVLSAVEVLDELLISWKKKEGMLHARS